ncbi:MAG: TerB family tellurite resistance protein [Deltaproteobacteria bacterium]|nr:TerB family tellurite resistance protein [Deltaproteobacteria bacterium]
MSTASTLQGFDTSRLEAVIELLYLAAAADEEFSDEERAHFRTSVESLTDHAVDDLDGLVSRVAVALQAEGRDARLAAVKARLPDPKMREVALQMAIRLMAVDGVVRTAERSLIMEAAEALEIDGDRAADMVARAGH